MASMEKIGKTIADEGLATQFGPYIFAFLGSGDVIRGAKETLSHLPHEWVSIGQLESLVKNHDYTQPIRKLYAVQVGADRQKECHHYV